MSLTRIEKPVSSSVLENEVLKENQQLSIQDQLNQKQLSSVNTIQDHAQDFDLRQFFTPSKPKLFPVEFDVIRGINNLSKVGTEMLKYHIAALDDCEQQMKELVIEKMQKLQESAQKASQSEFWSLLKKIGAVILAAISTVLGLSIIASGGGTLIGGVLIASGILAIANLALTEAGVWDWVAKRLEKDNEDKRKTIAILIPAVIGVLSGGLGAVGSIYGFAMASVTAIQFALTVGNAAFNIATGVTTIGKGVTDAQNLWIQAELQKIKENVILIQDKIDTETDHVQKFISGISEASKKVAQIIQMSIEANRSTMIQG